ncbi:MAG: hypothetical protein JWO60_2979 [Frankiales bacterium]|nr:hypothetical protein [Frankiales bacterium]
MTPADAAALKRRVLLTAVLTLVLFVTATYVHTALGVSDLWLAPVVVLLYLLVVRPLMAPVRAASRLRRDLAYQAWLDMRAEQDAP